MIGSNKMRFLKIEVDWRGAKSMRNFLVHEYFSVDNSFVWETIFETIPTFKLQIETIPKSIEK